MWHMCHSTEAADPWLSVRVACIITSVKVRNRGDCSALRAGAQVEVGLACGASGKGKPVSDRRMYVLFLAYWEKRERGLCSLGP